MAERPEFSISAGSVLSALEKGGTTQEQAEKYILDVMGRMEQDHPLLFSAIPTYIPEEADETEFTRDFWLTACLTYDSLMTQLQEEGRIVSIDEEDIARYTTKLPQDMLNYLVNVVYERTPSLVKTVGRLIRYSQHPEISMVPLSAGYQEVAIPFFLKILGPDTPEFSDAPVENRRTDQPEIAPAESSESGGFQLSEELVSEVLDRSGPDPLVTRMYIYRVKKRIREDNPFLFDVMPSKIPSDVDVTKYLRVYWLSASLTYDAITSQAEAEGRHVSLEFEDVVRYLTMPKEELDSVMSDILHNRIKPLAAYLGRLIQTMQQVSSDPELVGAAVVMGISDVSAPMFLKILE